MICFLTSSLVIPGTEDLNPNNDLIEELEQCFPPNSVGFIFVPTLMIMTVPTFTPLPPNVFLEKRAFVSGILMCWTAVTGCKRKDSSKEPILSF